VHRGRNAEARITHVIAFVTTKIRALLVSCSVGTLHGRTFNGTDYCTTASFTGSQTAGTLSWSNHEDAGESQACALFTADIQLPLQKCLGSLDFTQTHSTRHESTANVPNGDGGQSNLTVPSTPRCSRGVNGRWISGDVTASPGADHFKNYM